ncbi:MAG: SDR family NAD(P)-dependent oxidoreductase, partial [Acidimicrobiales bacterium]|nr:SDR family NAD(P)-dependent oxidoreductase [Acidimicrobiales bacterium]
MPNNAEGRVAIITGGGTGVGAATAAVLSSKNWSLMICGRRTEKLDEVRAELRSPCLTEQADVSNPADV